jgi:sulfite exporter TauE/SafE
VHAFGEGKPNEGHPGVGKRPFFIGLIHGLAGSAALMLFVLTTITSPWLGVVYVLIFGGGTIGGMLVMSTILGLPFALASRVFEGVVGKIQFAAGLGSLGFGVFYAWHVAAAGGVFSVVAH